MRIATLSSWLVLSVVTPIGVSLASAEPVSASDELASAASSALGGGGWIEWPSDSFALVAQGAGGGSWIEIDAPTELVPEEARVATDEVVAERPADLGGAAELPLPAALASSGPDDTSAIRADYQAGGGGWIEAD